MALYKVRASTTIKVTLRVNDFHTSPKNTGRVMTPTK